MNTIKKTKKIESQVKDKELIEIRRMEIVKAAVDIFVRKGFHKTTVREIAQKFGMSIGTLYEYIRTKEDILYLVCDYIHSSVGERVRPSLKMSGGSKKTLERAIYAYITIVDEMQDYIIFLYQETKSLSYDNRRYIFRAEDGTFLVDKKDISLIAHNIMVLGQMWAFRRWVLHRSYTLKHYINTQTTLILNELTPGI